MDIRSISLVTLISIAMVSCTKQNLADTSECKKVKERQMEIAKQQPLTTPPGATALKTTEIMLKNDEIHNKKMAEIKELNAEYAAKCKEK
jgi:hypothetical protein